MNLAEARCEHHLKIEVGTVLKGARGDDWMFTGWIGNTIGRHPLFLQVPVTAAPGGLLCPRWAGPVFVETLMRYFPEVGPLLVDVT